MRSFQYTTPHGITVTSSVSKVSYQTGLRGILRKLDRQRGIYLSSGYEYPGRYSRWDIAAIAPPIELTASGRNMEIRALNQRGATINHMLEAVLKKHPHWESFAFADGNLKGTLKPLPKFFPEEERSKQPSAFSFFAHIL